MSDLFVEYGNDMPLRLPMHKNPGLEIVYIKRGHLSWECDGTSEIVMPESIYFTLPWQEHGSTRLFEPGCELCFIVIKLPDAPADRPAQIQFNPQIRLPQKEEQEISQILNDSTRHTWPASPLMRTLMPEILNELKHPGTFHATRVQTLLKQIILELARTLDQKKIPTPNAAETADRLKTLLEKLDQQYSQKWTLDAMAVETGLKRTQFSKIFKYSTGESPLSYLTSLRIYKAIQLLENTPCSITEIALECGFSSSQHFANIFKNKTGQSPLKYRKSGLPSIQVPRIP